MVWPGSGHWGVTGAGCLQESFSSCCGDPNRSVLWLEALSLRQPVIVSCPERRDSSLLLPQGSHRGPSNLCRSLITSRNLVS